MLIIRGKSANKLEILFCSLQGQPSLDIQFHVNNSQSEEFLFLVETEIPIKGNRSWIKMTCFYTAIYLLYVPRTKNSVTSELSKIRRIARHFASALLIGRGLTKELRLLGEAPLRSEIQNKTRDITF